MKIYSNVDEVIKNLKLFSKTLNVGFEDGIEELGKYCQDVAKTNVIPYEKDPSTAEAVRNGIQLILEGNAKKVFKATVIATDDNSIFYEYGTGIVGSENAHPESGKANWIYNLPTPYKRTSSVTGLEGWFHQFPNTTRAIFTSGQPASAFMFKAYNATLNRSRKMLNQCYTEACQKALKG